jgi:hypothetical protein
MREVWRAVLGWEGFYEVSNRGRVRRVTAIDSRGRVWPGRVLKDWPHVHGYRLVTLARDGLRKAQTVHKTVLEAFHGKAPHGTEAAHLNGKRDDNRQRNLKWKTRKENFADKKLHGTQPMGERCHLSKLTALKVQRIRALVANGATHSAVARQYSMSREGVSHIVHRRTWMHI